MNEAAVNCELSVVIPCLNEADTIGACVAKALRAMQERGTAGRHPIPRGPARRRAPALGGQGFNVPGWGGSLLLSWSQGAQHKEQG